MRLVFCCLYLLLCQQTVFSMRKVRHAVAHDGFHNIEKERRWRNWPARVRSHHKRHNPV
ncbi:uncharacterized protein LOC119548201 [Drosophila subpulchrella]|nr:uncharacterized protein LOC119548201 [Drosophila subpulchrella]